MSETQIFLTTLAIVGGLLILTWLVCATWMLVLHSRYERALRETTALSTERVNALPLLMALMRPELTRADEILAPAIAVRQRILHGATTADEDEMDHQVSFLLTVANQHPQLLNDTKFLRIRGETEQREQRIAESRAALDGAVAAWNTALRRAKWIMFPGGWFLQQL